MAVNVLILFRLLLILVLIATCAGRQLACISGFHEMDRLVSDIIFPNSPVTTTTRLIPEMKFVCSGSIIGYTVAMRRPPPTPIMNTVASRQQSTIQIWRESNSQVHAYYKVGLGIPIGEAECVGGLTEVANNVFDCELLLIEGARISVQSGDIFGLQLPPENATAEVGEISFARVAKGPTNYIFVHRDQALLLPSPVVLSNSESQSQELPQIALRLELESGNERCMQGFPERNMLASKLLEDDGHSSTTVTILVPDMNFTCNGTLAGFTLVGINRRGDGAQDPKVQIWRENISESGSYYRIGAKIAVNISDNSACADGLPTVASRTYFCVLTKQFRVLIQPGDILGLELPPAHDNDFDILFTRGGGPMNYIFHQRINSTVQLSENDSLVQQLPQISFSLTSDECMSGFPDTVLPDGSGRGDNTQITTRLFPDLIFGCSGTIVRMTVAVVNRAGRQSPKIQIWRESETETGIYFRHGPSVPVVDSSSVCIRHRLSGGLFRCTLNESFQISVQPGDILGLELPPENDDDFDIYFKNGGPQNYIFEGQPDCSVNMSEAVSQSNDLPQIDFVVMLDDPSAGRQDESFLCENGHTTAATPALTTVIVTTELDSEAEDSTDSNIPSIGTVIGITILGCCFVAACLAFLIIAVAVIFKKYKSSKRQSVVLVDKHIVGHDELQSHEYEKIPENSKLHNSDLEAKQDVKLTEFCPDSGIPLPYLENNEYVISDQYYQAIQENDEYCQMMMAAPARPDDTDHFYWEPADSVNELYKQLCSNKYREIARDQVKIGEELGSGQFGVVSRGVWESPKGAMDVAVKQLQSGASEEEKVKFLQEAAINGQFRHPNLVMLMGVVTVGEPVMIVLELLSNGDLKSFLMKCQPQMKLSAPLAEIDEQLLLKFCQHIASGMSYLASKSFVHRDLAARNILVSKDRICKISDFGMSRNLVDEKYIAHGGMVPVKWMSPEAINYNKYSTASDVWSFGCVMYEIWSLGHGPFKDLSNAEAVSAIEKGYRLPPPPGMSKELYKIMIQCWQPESSHRPTFPQLVEMLSQADFELFVWEEDDLRYSDPQVRLIGAPLEVAKDLYHDLQKSFVIP